MLWYLPFKRNDADVNSDDTDGVDGGGQRRANSASQRSLIWICEGSLGRRVHT